MAISHEDQELADRISARVMHKDDAITKASHGVFGTLFKLCSLGRLINACDGANQKHDAFDPSHLSEIGSLMTNISEDAMGDMDNLIDRYEDLLYDAKHAGKESELSKEAVEVAQRFDTLDAEQRDTLRRVLRQFPI